MQFVKGNICSSDLVTYVLREEQIDTIIHFAAQTHVDNSFGNSFTFTHNNIMGTHVLLESAKEIGTIKRFIHVSTDEVYGEGEVSSVYTDTYIFSCFYNIVSANSMRNMKHISAHALLEQRCGRVSKQCSKQA
jgi:dTDP-D-glucose 4,6-dehydratase